MKIEKINDNQIRCTLTRADLEERHISLGEFAYGTDKARSLFREMMLKANRECGWTNEQNIPLMIEAIPDKENSLVLVITKVDDPEELDTRFSKFSATDVMPDSENDVKVEGADDILDLFRKIIDQKKGPGKPKKGIKNQGQGARTAQGARSPEREQEVSLTRAYRFSSFDRVLSAASALKGVFSGKSSLYRQKSDGAYVLIAHQSGHTPEEFNKICNILSEYGSSENYSPASEAHLMEHEQAVMLNSALARLATIGGGN